MVTPAAVSDLVAQLPDAEKSTRPDGGAEWRAGRHVFVRLVDVDAAWRARLWSGDMSLAHALRERPRVFVAVDEFRFRVAFEVALPRIGRREFAELLLDSYAVRCGRRRADAVDLTRFFA
jgi:hypothetical protein